MTVSPWSSARLHPAPGAATAAPIRLFLADDSMVIRTIVASWIEHEPDLELVGVACDGAEAVQMIAGVQADVCILDLEMPVMGGLEALPKLLRLRPDLKVLIASRLTRAGAEATMRALEAGAAECLPKPEASGLHSADGFRRELLTKVRELGRAPPKDRPAAPCRPPRLRPLAPSAKAPEVLALAASTGGPPALRKFLEGLPRGYQQTVVIVQHMPAAFIELLAIQLTKTSGVPVSVAKAGATLEPGRAYLAPGDHHLRVTRSGQHLVADIDQSPPENYCRPAADVLFRSVAKACGARAIGVVLTGMGRDGWSGAEAITRAGGVVLAQDEASSVVWGMPGGVVEGGFASVVGPVDRLAAATVKLSRGETPKEPPKGETS